MAFDELSVRRARLLEVSVPLRVPFAISGGTLLNRKSLIVELEAEDGTLGWGEAAPFEMPFYSAETIASAHACLRDVLIPRVLKQAFRNPSDLHVRLGENVRGNHMARAAIDTAWWDLQARRQSVSLAELVDLRLRELGLSEPLRAGTTLSCGAALGIPESGRVEDLLTEMHAALKRGFLRIKLKVKPGWCATPVAAVLEELRRIDIDVPVSVDGNGAFDRRRDTAELKELDAVGPVFIEQPFGGEDLWDAVVWGRTARTPLCLDESLTSDSIARQVLEMRGPTVWNLKVQRLGGLEEVCRVYATGFAEDVEMWVGTMPESGLGAQAAIALGGLRGLKHVSDVGPSEWWFREGADLIALEMDESGAIQVPEGPSGVPNLAAATVLVSW